MLVAKAFLILIVWMAYKDGYTFFPKILCICSTTTLYFNLGFSRKYKNHTKVDKTHKVERKKKHEIGIQYIEEENTWAENEK